MARQRQNYFLTPGDVESLKARAKNWGGICILCGEPFKNILSITKDHITPQCLMKKGERPFLAACHYRCNNFRQDSSLIQTAKKLAELKIKWGEERFFLWVNKRVPCRKAPEGTDISI
jgi:hypothetical protein